MHAYIHRGPPARDLEQPDHVAAQITHEDWEASATQVSLSEPHWPSPRAFIGGLKSRRPHVSSPGSRISPRRQWIKLPQFDFACSSSLAGRACLLPAALQLGTLPLFSSLTDAGGTNEGKPRRSNPTPSNLTRGPKLGNQPGPKKRREAMAVQPTAQEGPSLRSRGMHQSLSGGQTHTCIHTHTYRQTRQADRQTDSHPASQPDRQTERQRDKETDLPTYLPTYIYTYIYIYPYIYMAYIYIHKHACVCVYIYIFGERERLAHTYYAHT